jgi:hypothetical protein
MNKKEQYAEDPDVRNSELTHAIQIEASAKMVEENHQNSHAS